MLMHVPRTIYWFAFACACPCACACACACVCAYATACASAYPCACVSVLSMCKCICMHIIESILPCFNFFNVHLNASSVLKNWSKLVREKNTVIFLSVPCPSLPFRNDCLLCFQYLCRLSEGQWFSMKKNANGKYDRAEWKIRPRQELNEPSL